MLDLLQKISHRYSLKVFAYCFLPGSLHLLVEPYEENLGRALQVFFSRYATAFNRKYDRTGHLFGGPYRQFVLLDDTYILASSVYIHLDPVRSGSSDVPQKYPWSSCRLYVNKSRVKSFADPGFILELLPGGNERKKRRVYQELLVHGQDMAAGQILEQHDFIHHFRTGLSANFPSIFRQMDNECRAAKSLGIDLLSIKDLEDQADEIRMGYFTNGRSTRRTRRYLVEQLIARGNKRSDVAERLGISLKTVYNLLRAEFDPAEDLEM